MAQILIKRLGFWAGIGKIAAGIGLILTAHVDAGIAVIIGGVSSIIHSGEANKAANKNNNGQ